MAKNTTNLKLYEKESTDENDTFNIQQMLNDNWDKIDNAVKDNTDTITSLGGTGRTTETVKGNADDLASHLSDYVRQPGYGVDSGAANVYAISLSPTPTAYVDGMGIIVKIANANTGASTLNVNSLGAKSIKNPDGTDLSSGDLVAGGIYSFKYNATSGNFILVGKGGVKLTGTVTADKVLNPYTFYSTDAKTKGTGSMANNGAVTITPSTADQAISEGYHNGSGKVKGDANLISSNILNGTSIFGVVGSVIAGKRYASGTATSSTNAISGLAFTPRVVVIYFTNLPYSGDCNIAYKEGSMFVNTQNSEIPYISAINANGFSLNSLVNDATWEAWE